jgi:ASC-1-like (ASCH) protein
MKKALESSKKWVIRFRTVDKKNFDEITSRLKLIETRAATENYRRIKKGDTLTIVCGKNRIEREIKKVEFFKNIDAMIRKIPYRKVMPSVASIAEMKKIYKSYSGYKEKLKSFGIVAWTLK